MSTADAPVREGDRLDYLDILRGFAVLMIFAVNIKAMAMPFAYYVNPTLWPGDHDQLIATIQAYLVDNKWRTNFTALFGAGMVLIGMKAEAAGKRGTARVFTRNCWLLVFGLVHLLLIWMGDILTMYAITGFIAMWFRNLSKRTLGWCTLGLMVVALAWTSVFGMGPAFVPEVGTDVGNMMWGNDPAVLQHEIDAYTGGFLSQTRERITTASGMLVMYFFLGGWFMITLALMVAGMWLFKLGFYRGALSAGNYGLMAATGLAVSFGLEALRQQYLNESGWTIDAYSMYTPVTTVSGLAGAFGYAALVAFCYRLGMRFGPVAAAGRMAFSNYIACSVIGTTIYYGHGGGLFGTATQLPLMAIVLVTWAAILIWSPLWLKAFYFGPLEWVWRSLTYWKIQPFRRAAPAPKRDEAAPA